MMDHPWDIYIYIYDVYDVFIVPVMDELRRICCI